MSKCSETCFIVFPVLENPQLDTHHDYIGQKYEIIFFGIQRQTQKWARGPIWGSSPGIQKVNFFFLVLYPLYDTVVKKLVGLHVVPGPDKLRLDYKDIGFSYFSATPGDGRGPKLGHMMVLTQH